MLAVTILGNNSAIPAFDRHPTAQALVTFDQTFLIDCGEGTQMQINKYKMRPSRINHIFISHLHGDHYFGLIGLISSMALLGRKADLNLYAPGALKEIIDLQFKVADSHLPFNLVFHPLQDEGLLFEDKKISIECFHVYHRVPCWGFLFREKKNLRKIVPEKMAHYNIPVSFYDNLHMGMDFVTSDNETIPNELLTSEATPGKSYAYCADSVFNLEIATKVKGVDLLYHEATYLHDLEERAHARFHSTSTQAATIAKEAGAARLLLGHFSSKYEILDPFREEAATVFPNCDLALEGTSYLI